MLSPARRWGAATLGLGLIGGLAAASARAPLAWMLGPMAVVTVAGLAGAPMRMSSAWRHAMLSVLGVALGSSARPEMLAQLGGWSLSLLAVPLYLVLCAAAGWAFLRRRPGVNPVTAYYGAMPGGLAEIVLAGAQSGGDPRQLSALHASRILFVVFLTPILFALSGHPIPARQGPAATLLAPWPGAAELAALILLALLGAQLGKLLRLPAAALLGPMIVSVVAHAGGWIAAAPPPPVVAAAQLVVGCALGARFVGGAARETLRMMGYGAVLALMMTAAAVAVAALRYEQSGDLAAAAALLAYSPGGLAEMSLIALLFSIDPTFVVAHHLVRVALVIGLARPVQRLLFRAPPPAASPPAAEPPP